MYKGGRCTGPGARDLPYVYIYIYIYISLSVSLVFFLSASLSISIFNNSYLNIFELSFCIVIGWAAAVLSLAGSIQLRAEHCHTKLNFVERLTEVKTAYFWKVNTEIPVNVLVVQKL